MVGGSVVVVVVVVVVVLVVVVGVVVVITGSVARLATLVIVVDSRVVADNSVVAVKSVIASSLESVVLSEEESVASLLDASTKLFWPCCTKAYKSNATLSIEHGYSVVALSVVVEAMLADVVEDESDSS